MASITAYTTKSGRRWQVQWTRPDGRRTRTRGFRTKSEAQAWVEEQGHARRHGAWVDPADGRTTVSDIGDRWLAAQTHLKPSTWRVTEHTWRCYVEPEWGRYPVGNIRQSDIQAWVSNIDRSASTVRRAHACLAQVLDAAVADRLVASNPARGVRLPRKARARHVYLSMEQVRMLADECSHHGEIVWVLATTGLRWGELAGLQVADIDLDKRRIHVRRAAVAVGSRVEVGEPKTHKRRTVAVPRFVCNMLAPMLEGRDGGEWVWHRRDGGPLPNLTHGSWFFEARDRLVARDPDFPAITPHGLRHVAAGLLVGAGANVKVVQRQLGHASATMTLDVYADLFDGDLDAVADTMEDLHSELCEPKVSQIPKSA
ncbi:site-specific integrase [Corynebacterium sp. TAE3-ERU12]|uniref:tyrosine-type recombinase/integrase n=1 Tax=Corynebacterium sp. TAE3-ERU12 TaxID=2849491 RepID=UPI001C476530|nr:site-specific integrase [Corynebacterium sp. TAE3-ERU12]MBV7294901.1 site-specific integrase [Corynebacterium sp. TAE3-ERU12]